MAKSRLIEASVADLIGIQEEDNVLFLGLHPDDIAMFYSEAIRKARSLRGKAHLLTVTDGENSPNGDLDLVTGGGRRSEAEAEARIFKVPPSRQHYLGMPDIPYYYDEKRRAELTDRFKEKIALIMPKVIFTPGAFGVDDHPAHCAGHETMIDARDVVSPETVIWGRAMEEDSELILPVDRYYKLLAIAQHTSQFPTEEGEDGVDRFTDFANRQLSPYIINGHLDIEAYARY
jgi:LmbE family N-acetylglucosaminyl deacetylase